MVVSMKGWVLPFLLFSECFSLAMLVSFCKNLLKINPKRLTLVLSHRINSPISTHTHSADKPSSLTLFYLINSCGLSPEAALSASKEINLSSTERPNSVLEFFKTHGFSSNQIKSLISTRPQFLLADIDRKLKPKFKFFNDAGFSDAETAAFVSSNPGILLRSLHNRTIPSIDFLRNLVLTNENVIKVFQRCGWTFTCNLRKRMEPNVSLLNDFGLPKWRISKMVVIEPRILSVNTVLLRKALKRIDELGFDRGSDRFVMAVHALCTMDESMWASKIDLLRDLGWSLDEIFDAFRKMPIFMKCSEKKIRAGMNFFVNKLRWRPSDVASHPMLLVYSMKRRLVPRLKIFKILMYKELIAEEKLKEILTLSEKDFLRMYVDEYENEIPYLSKAYSGDLGYSWLTQRCKMEKVGNDLSSSCSL